MDLSSIFTQMALLFAVIALGYIATKCHVLDANSNRHFSNLVICITNPCTVLHSVLAGEHVLTNGEVFQLTGYSFAVFMGSGLLLLGNAMTDLFPSNDEYVVK